MKVRTPTVVALLVAVAALVAPASPAQASPTDAAFNSTTGALNVNYAGYLSKHDIVYNRLNTNPLHGLCSRAHRAGAQLRWPSPCRVRGRTTPARVAGRAVRRGRGRGCARGWSGLGCGRGGG